MCVKNLKVSKQRARQAMQGKWETDKIIIKRKNQGTNWKQPIRKLLKLLNQKINKYWDRYHKCKFSLMHMQ